MRWQRKRMDLAERLRPYVSTCPPPEPMVDVDPIRMFLVRWMIETGDPIEVVAKGFNLDVAELVRLLSGDERRISGSDARRIRRSLRLVESEELDYSYGARSVTVGRSRER